jgi:hypothetical protein
VPDDKGGISKPQLDIIPIELRQVLVQVNVTDVTPEAARVLVAQAEAQVKIAEAEASSRAEVAKADATAKAEVAKADTDKHVRTARVVAWGMAGLAAVIGGLVIVVGILSEWDAATMAAVTVPIAVVLLSAAPKLIAWLLKRLGGGG